MADTLGEQNIRITTSGVMAAERQMNRLGESFSKVASAARLITGAGGLAIGGILRESLAGTVEGERFSKALENLTRSLGEGFAPRVRQSTGLLNQWAAKWRELQPETQATIADIALLTVTAGVAVSVLGNVARGISGIVGLFGTLGVNRLAIAIGPTAGIVAGLLAAGAAAKYLFDAFTKGATEISRLQFEISRGWVLTVGTIMNKLGIISDADMAFISRRIGMEQEARRLDAVERAAAAGGAGAGGPAGAGRDVKGFTPYIRPEFLSGQAHWEQLMKGLAASDPLLDINKAQLGKLDEIDEKLGAGLGAAEKLKDMIPAVR